MARDKFDGQPIEQSLVGRRVTLRAEIFGGLDQANAEIHLPKMIDGDAGGERIAGIDDPLGEGETVARSVGRKSRLDDGCVGRDLVALEAIVTALEDESVARFFHVGHDHG